MNLICQIVIFYVKRCPNPLRDNIDNVRYVKQAHLFLS